MTPDTQLSDRLQQKRPVFRSMRVMAAQATLLFHRRVYTCVCRGFIMALVTQGTAVLNQDQLVGIAVVIVTRFAINFLNGGMHYFLSGDLLRPLGMTIAAFGRRSRGHCQQGHQNPTNNRKIDFPFQILTSQQLRFA